MNKKHGDSTTQQIAEGYLISKLAEAKGIKLVKKRFILPNGRWLELDGYCKSPLILCEAWAHIGAPKVAQKHKVMNDALKMIFLNKIFYKDAKSTLILVFADKNAAQHFQGTSWMAQCLKEYNIEIQIVELPRDVKASIQNAQKSQYR